MLYRKRAGGGPGNRSGGCARSLGEARGGESAAKLLYRQGHQALLVGVGGVSPAKGDLVAMQRDEAMVGDGDAMGVGTQVVEDILGAAKGRLAGFNRVQMCMRVVLNQTKKGLFDFTLDQ